MIDTLNLLHTRRSVVAKDITSPAPNPQELEAILKAAIRVPDHGKISPWRIQVLHETGQKKLGDVIAKRFVEKHADATEAQIEFERQRSRRAPLLLVVASTPDENKYFKAPYVEQLLSAGAVCQNILIATYAQGYVGQWLTEWIAYDDEVKHTLGYDAKVEIAGFIYIGSSNIVPDDRLRPDFSEIISEFS